MKNIQLLHSSPSAALIWNHVSLAGICYRPWQLPDNGICLAKVYEPTYSVGPVVCEPNLTSGIIPSSSYLADWYMQVHVESIEVLLLPATTRPPIFCIVFMLNELFLWTKYTIAWFTSVGFNIWHTNESFNAAFHIRFNFKRFEVRSLVYLCCNSDLHNWLS